jgi:hypothetical protein
MILIFANIAGYCMYIHPSWPVLTLVIVKESILDVEVTEMDCAIINDGIDDDDGGGGGQVIGGLHPNVKFQDDRWKRRA